MLRKLTPWLLCFLCLGLLGLGATSFGLLVDRILLGVRFAVVIFLSVLVVPGRLTAQSVGDSLLQRLTRWSIGNGKPANTRKNEASFSDNLLL